MEDNHRAYTRPYQVEISKAITGVVCGLKHCFLIANDQSVYAWGDNSFGQLALDSESEYVGGPSRIELPFGVRVQQVKSGKYHVHILSD